MNYIRTVLKRPVSAILIIISIIIFGIGSISGMQMEYFPDLEMPMEVVYVTYAGADADSVESLVIEPIEDIGGTLTGINSITSNSYDNYGTVQFSYEYGTDLDDAYMELKEGIDNLATDLPEGCDTPTIMEVSLDSDATISIAAKSTDGSDIVEYVNDTVVPELESINGVSKVDISGATDKYLKLVLDEEKMKQYGLSISTIANYIAGANFDMPVGEITSGSQDISATANSEIDWREDLQNIAITTSTGALINLSDIVSTMNIFSEDADSLSRYNGQDSLLIQVTKKSSAETIKVCNAVEDALSDLQNSSVEYETIHSTADDIMDTLQEVLVTLIEGVLFTMVILFVFLGDIKASLIVGSSMPLSLFIAAICLNVLGVPFDLMTGTGMIIAIGMLVDNSIVVLESCFRMKEEEKSFKEAAIKGAGTMMMSVGASTLTTIVVYAPMTISAGLSGQMNKPLCYTVILTMIASLISAITVVPLMYTLIKPKANSKLPINKLLDILGNGYQWIIPKFLRHAKITIFAAVLLFVFSIGLATTLKFDIFPPNYDGSMKIEADFRSGTKLEIMDESIQNIEQKLLEDKNFDSVELSIDGSIAEITAYSADGSKRSSQEAVDYYTSLFENIPNMDLNITPTGVTTGLASLMSSGNNVTVTIVSDDMSSLKEGANVVADALSTVPGVLNVKNDFSQSKTTAKFDINQQAVMNAGLQPASVATQIYYMLNGITATTIDGPDDETYDVILQYPDDKYNEPMILLDQPITTSDGTSAALKSFCTVKYSENLQTIKRQDDQFLAEITATTGSGDKKYITSDAISKAMEDVSLPDGVEQAESTVDKTLNDEMGTMGTALIIAVFLVFLVMAVQFESVRFSLMVMMCIPFSFIGSFGLMFLFDQPLSMMAAMGFLMLIGMVVNNGILLVDGTNKLRETLPLNEALLQAGLTRLRPILMTTLTTVLSMMPLLISSDSGMNMMKGMGIVIVGGLVASTTMAMFLMPPFYLLISGCDLDGNKKEHKLFGRKRKKR